MATRGSGLSNWHDAIREYSKINNIKYKIPKKGSTEYNEIKKIQNSMISTTPTPTTSPTSKRKYVKKKGSGVDLPGGCKCGSGVDLPGGSLMSAGFTNTPIIAQGVSSEPKKRGRKPKLNITDALQVV